MAAPLLFFHSPPLWILPNPISSSSSRQVAPLLLYSSPKAPIPPLQISAVGYYPKWAHVMAMAVQRLFPGS
ncbi:hypothetical protein Cni_G02227 [Canna indica]|uniref:Uncharacterized protein n=1 Tax=Canna indica TaxID=4628 RepID=A0AAQ3JNU5_9LILI|nr:hypothetical protein Cni_G02227 [Canna indica]